jgi:hypothetical protein
MKAPKYTDLELIQRVWDVETVKKLAAKRCYYIANDWREQELRDLWVTGAEAQKTASFGRNWGYYVGMDNIREYYVTKHRKEMDALPGSGRLFHHPVSTGLVQEAYDGKTARGLWYCISQETLPTSDTQADARWYLEKLAIDFLKEDGQWKIRHIVIATDLQSEAGENYMEQKVDLPDQENAAFVEFGTPTISMRVHQERYNWLDNYPAPPTPYAAFDEDNSYGPEGHPDYEEAE